MPKTATRDGAADPTREFLDALVTQGAQPLVAQKSGVLRIDLTDDGRTRRWYVTLDKGEITVASKGGDADAVVRTDKATFDRLVTGQTNATAALLRGALAVEGALDLMILFQRLFPGPPRQEAKGEHAVEAQPS